MSRLRLLKFVGVYTLLGFVPLAISFFLLPLYASHLSPAEYGVLNSANITHTFTSLLITLGIDGAVTVFFFDFDTDEKRYELLGTAMFGVLGLTIVALGILAVTGHWLFAFLWKALPFAQFGWFILASALAQVVYSVVFCWYRTTENLRMAAGVSVGTTLASLAGSVVAIVYVRPDALGAFVGKTAGTIIGILPFAIALFRHVPRRIDRDLLRRLFGYGIPATAYAVLLYLLFNGDRIVMEKWFTAADLGLYALGATLIMPIEVVLQAGHNAVMPVFYRKLQAKSPEVSEQISQFYVAVLLFNVVALVIAVLLAEPVLGLFRGARYVGSAYFVAMLAYSQMFRVLYNAYAFSMFFAKHTKPFPIIAIVSIAVGMAVAWVACRLVGPLGIGIGVVGWKGAQAVATRFAMKRLDTVQVEVGSTVPWLVAVGFYVTAMYHLRAYRPGAAQPFAVAGGVALVAAAVWTGARLAKRLGVLGGGSGTPASNRHSGG